MRFYDRDRELEWLGKARRAVVLGRRRIGKTRLLEEAVSKPFIYLFFFADASEAFIIRKWSAEIEEKGVYIPAVSGIEDIIEYLFRNVDLPVVVDEIQNCHKRFPGFVSHLQYLMDEFKERKVYITGSLVSLMKKFVEDYKSPLFGRFDFVIKLRELDIKTVLEIMSDLGYGWEEALQYYAVFGGIPKYYELIETLKPRDFVEFVTRMFFQYPRPLFNETYVMLKEEIGKEFANYFGVLHAISQHGVTFGAIASSMNMVSTSVSKYLSSLVNDFELVGKIQPISRKKKQTHYHIQGNIVDFWFQYCFSQRDYLDRGDEKTVARRFRESFPVYFGKKLEEMVLTLLPGFLERMGIEYSPLGKDWGKTYEFDFVVDSHDVVYIGEIKSGELNVPAMLKKIDGVVARETFYNNREVRYIFIARFFSNRVESKSIHYFTLEEFFN